MRRIRVLCTAATLAASLTAAPARAQLPVSFTGNFSGTIVSQGPGRCGPNRVTVDAVLSGLLSPFGTATGSQSVCVDPVTLDVLDGLFTLTLPGGTLFGISFGAFVRTGPQLFSGSQTITITGGTGVFDQATGGGTTHGTQNLATGAVTSGVTGSVAASGLTSVPEPSLLALLVGGLVGAAAVGRSTRRRRVIVSV